MKNYGFKNELDFVTLFNDKYLEELNDNSICFLKDIFKDNIDNSDKIKCWKNKLTQKADIFIKYKNEIKSISIKYGEGNSLHCESVEEFKRYLEKLGIPYKYISFYCSFHYGYFRDQNGKIDFSKRLSAKDYCKYFENEVNIFNNEINKTKIIIDMVDRFIIRGKNSDYDIDALIAGDIENYVWIKKYDIYDLILSKRNYQSLFPHASCMSIGPKARSLGESVKNNSDRYLVSVKWHYLKDDIENFIKHKNDNIL